MESKLDKFKLISGGMGGMEVWRIEPVRKNKIVTLDRVHRIRDVPIDKPLRQKIQKLKYFYLALTRHWMAPFDKYMDHENKEPLPITSAENIPVGQQILKHLWNDTAITGVSMKSDGFVITGSIEVVTGKTIGISTPYITPEDDYAFYAEAVDFIEEINREISKYLYSNLLPLEDAKEQYMIEQNIKELTPEDEERLTDKLIEKFHEKGAIVLMNEEYKNDALEASNEGVVSIHQSRNNIAKGRFEEAKKDDDDDEQIIIGENKGKVPNEFTEATPSDGERDLSDLESSDDMLIENSWEDD